MKGVGEDKDGNVTKPMEIILDVFHLTWSTLCYLGLGQNVKLLQFAILISVAYSATSQALSFVPSLCLPPSLTPKG